MQTLIAIPPDNYVGMDLNTYTLARAYCQTDDGKVLGPFWPCLPRGDVRPAQSVPLDGTLKEMVEKIWPRFRTAPPTLEAGHYYPRIYRTGEALREWACVPPLTQTPFLSSFVASIEQIEALFDSLAAIFKVAHPEQGNLSTYGAEIRSLLILACTEVEAQWVGVLKANGVQGNGDRYSTNHYVRLLPVMRLEQYKVQIIRYPGLPHIAPFGTWDPAEPTQSLPWYDAYNKAKHNREENFTLATLNNAINAVAACVVMLAAQFGSYTLGEYGFRNPFRFTTTPLWEPPDWYYGPLPGVDWQQVNCQILK